MSVAPVLMPRVNKARGLLVMSQRVETTLRWWSIAPTLLLLAGDCRRLSVTPTMVARRTSRKVRPWCDGPAVRRVLVVGLMVRGRLGYPSASSLDGLTLLAKHRAQEGDMSSSEKFGARVRMV